MPTAAEIRKFIVDSFKRNELETFCFDHFKQVYKDYAGTAGSNSDLAQALIAYCEQKKLTGTLLAALKEARPVPFKESFETAPQSTANQPAPTEEHTQVSSQPIADRPPIEKTQHNRTWRTITVIAATALSLAAVIYIAFIAPSREPSAAPTQLAAIVAERPTEAAASSATTSAPALPVLAAIPDASETCPGRLESGPDPAAVVRLRLVVAAGSVAYLHGDDISLEGRDPLTSTLVAVFGPYDGAVAVRNGVLCAPLPADTPVAAETYAELQAECDGCRTAEIRPAEEQP